MAPLKASGGSPALDEPEAVEALLDLAVGLNAASRRLLFYCSCQYRYEDRRPFCHRCLVTDELVARARRRKQRLTVVEWPGTPLPEKPEVWTLPAKVVKAVAQGRKTFPVDGADLASHAAVAWATPVWLTAEAVRVPVLVGPARYQANTWVTPVLHTFDAHATWMAERAPDGVAARVRHGRSQTRAGSTLRPPADVLNNGVRLCCKRRADHGRGPISDRRARGEALAIGIEGSRAAA